MKMDWNTDSRENFKFIHLNLVDYSNFMNFCRIFKSFRRKTIGHVLICQTML